MIKQKIELLFKWSLILPFLAIVLMLLLQNYLLNHFSYKIIDSDQTILWLQASDIAKGNWISPFFYGQMYNIPVEAFIGALFIKLGFSVKYAVPLAANLLGFSPWAIAVVIASRLKNRLLVLLIATVYLIMPIEYHFLSVMARGFIGGIAVFILGLLFLIRQNNPLVLAFGFFICFFSIFINPNVVLLGFTIGIFLLLENKTNLKKYIIPFGIAVLLNLFTAYKLHQFKLANPSYNLHLLWKMDFGFTFFKEAMQEYFFLFKGIFPFLYELGVLFFPLIFAIGYFIYKKYKFENATFAYLGFIGILIASLFINKITDGSGSLFFSYSRMFLAIPFCYILFAYLIFQKIEQKKRIEKMLFIGCLFGFSLQLFTFSPRLTRAAATNSGDVHLISINKLCEQCDEIAKLAKQKKANLIVFHSKADEFNYGCKVLHPEINTLHPNYERRIWEFNKLAYLPLTENVLVFDWLNQDTIIDSHLQKLDNISFPVYLLKDSNESIYSFYIKHHLQLRKYLK